MQCVVKILILRRDVPVVCPAVHAEIAKNVVHEQDFLKQGG